MKKNFKRLFILLLCIVTSVVTIMNVNAEVVIETFKAVSKTIEVPIKFATDFHIIKTTDGKHVYCLEYRKKSPNESVIYTKDYLITNNGMNYLLKEGKNAKNDTEHFIYKSALWIYMVENGLMEGTNRNIKEYYEEVKQSKTTEAKKILELVENAKKAGVNDTSAPTIKVNVGTGVFKLDESGKYYVSNAIAVNSSTGTYDVKLTNAKEGILVEKNGNTFVIKVEADKVTSLKTNIGFEVTNSRDIYVSYSYKPSNSVYQPVAATFKETKTAKAEGSLTLETTVQVPFLKVDAENGKVVEGAVLKVTDSNDKLVDEWTTTGEEHVIVGLTEGTYTLTEVSAPSGYRPLDASIKFTIDKNGKILDSNNNEVTIIKVLNYKYTGGVSISKQDITNKQELPGATLVIKDSEGNIIDKWVSGTEPHFISIEKIKPGKYTLTEILQPKGYELSKETIEFEVKDNGKILPVVMYNKPEGKDVPVEPTSSFKSTTSELFGSLIILVGGFMIIKNYKKKEKFN